MCVLNRKEKKRKLKKVFVKVVQCEYGWEIFDRPHQEGECIVKWLQLN